MKTGLYHLVNDPDFGEDSNDSTNNNGNSNDSMASSGGGGGGGMLDVFGQAVTTTSGVPALKKQCECVCPNCQRNLAASRFAPHLEKCMGMGRNSSRIASRRLANSNKVGTTTNTYTVALGLVMIHFRITKNATHVNSSLHPCLGHIFTAVAGAV